MPGAKPVLCIQTGKIFQSLNQAAKEVHCCPKGISLCCQGKYLQYKGFNWKFIKIKRPEPMSSAEYSKLYRKKHPWITLFRGAKLRCTNPNHRSYKRYGGRGIQLRLTKEDIKKIYFRDGGDSLKGVLNCHRIDDKGHYEYGNVVILQKSDHVDLHKGEKLLSEILDSRGQTIFEVYYENDSR